MLLEKETVIDSPIIISDTVLEIKPSPRKINKDDIVDAVGLNGSQLSELLELINEYRMCVALDLTELGCTLKQEF